MYHKEVIYLGLYKDGERLGNAGFLKVERRDKAGKLSLTVKNVPRSIEGRFPVRCCSGTECKELDDITLRAGCGQWESQEQDSPERIRLQITLPGGYLVEGENKAARQTAVPEQPKEPVLSPPGLPAETRPVQPRSELSKESEPVSPPPELSREPEAVPAAPQLSGEPEAVPAPPQPLREPEPVLLLPKLQKQEHPEKGRTEKKRSAKIEHICVQRQEPAKILPEISAGESAQKPLMADTFSMEGLKEDKWAQILETYDAIHPYDDERVYVKLTPRDFIILPSKYQHLVNNSFLLHGFYNYRHVILGKEEAYYLGVPGVYYEREKMVALMFGFEAFECADEKPKDGVFGYYLRKVEI